MGRPRPCVDEPAVPGSPDPGGHAGEGNWSGHEAFRGLAATIDAVKFLVEEAVEALADRPPETAAAAG